MLSTLLLSATIVLFVLSLLSTSYTHWGMAQLDRLCDVPCPPWKQWPSVSVIIAARNEEKHIEAGARSLLALDYPQLELIAVDDRSTDATGKILDDLAAEDPRLQVVHVTELPPGWLGKTHAMQSGADRATGEWLLFTDADVILDPTTLRRALGYIDEHRLDNLSLLPDIISKTWLLEAVVSNFTVFLCMFLRPWDARTEGSSAYIGVGAFNMLPAAVYKKIGGHEPLRMRPDDDIKLGKLIKDNGYRQDVCIGLKMCRVPWYDSVNELILGLEKNSFAALEYSIPMLLLAATASLVLNFSPFVIAVAPVDGATRSFAVATVILHLVLAWRTAVAAGVSWTAMFMYPFTVLLLSYIHVRSMVLTLWRGGIRWRDTFYPLSELRKNVV